MTETQKTEIELKISDFKDILIDHIKNALIDKEFIEVPKFNVAHDMSEGYVSDKDILIFNKLQRKEHDIFICGECIFLYDGSEDTYEVDRSDITRNINELPLETLLMIVNNI